VQSLPRLQLRIASAAPQNQANRNRQKIRRKKIGWR